MESFTFSSLQANPLALQLALSNLQNNVSLRMINSNSPYLSQLNSQLLQPNSMLQSSPSVLTKRLHLPDHPSMDTLQKKVMTVQPSNSNLNMLNPSNNLNFTALGFPNSGNSTNPNLINSLLQQEALKLTQVPNVNSLLLAQQLSTVPNQQNLAFNNSILQYIGGLVQTSPTKQDSLSNTTGISVAEKRNCVPKIEPTVPALQPSTSLNQKTIKLPEVKPSISRPKKDEKSEETKTIGSETEASSTMAKSPREDAIEKVQALGDNISLNDMTKLFPDWDLITIFEYLSCGKNKEEFLKERQEKTERMRELAFLSVKKRRSKLKTKEGGVEKKGKKSNKKKGDKKKNELEDEAYY